MCAGKMNDIYMCVCVCICFFLLLKLNFFGNSLHAHSVDASKDTERLGRFINDDHIKPNSKIKIVSPSSYCFLVLVYTYSSILNVVLFDINTEYVKFTISHLAEALSKVTYK